MRTFFKAIHVKARVISALYVRAIKSEHGKTKIGYISALLKPLGQIIMISLMFMAMGRIPVIGDSLTLFIATAIIPYNLCIGLANKMLQINKSHRVIFDTTIVSPIDVSITFLLMESLLILIASLVILAGLGFLKFWDYSVDSLLGILLTILISIILGYGLGLFNFAIATLVPAYENLWKILSMPLFFMSGVFYVVDPRFPPEVLSVLYYNPLLHITELMRENFYRSWNSTFVDETYLISATTIILFFGLLMQKLTEKKKRI